MKAVRVSKPLLFNSFNSKQFAKLRQRLDTVLDDKRGLPDGKGRRTTLTEHTLEQLKLDLIIAVGHAGALASEGPLHNRIEGRGRPPDNAAFIFIDDLMQACSAAGLKPGRRFTAGSESLPVQLYKALAPLIRPGRSRNPRRQFDRWHRNRSDLSRRVIVPLQIRRLN